MITINIDKAKSIAHEARRAARDAEFAPHDDAIAKRIPGAAEQESETQRQSIRSKYAAMQEAIDAAATVDEIKAAMPQ
jgi:hypothetical protein